MRCSYSCFEVAQFKCRCQQAYMCVTHLGKHLETLKKHEFEVLEIDLEQSRLQMIKSETFKRIQKIDEAKKMIACTTKSLIKTIEKAEKEAIIKLDHLRKKYFEILEHNKFCDSELPIIEKIETMDLEIKTVGIDRIMNRIKKVYRGDFVNYLDKRGISYIDMSLKQKIDYYYPIVLKENFGSDLNKCHSCGKELLVSKDGKYLFFCKFHLGI